jgi:hypothetical protein
MKKMPIRLFISYSHKDEDFKKDFEDELIVLKRTDQVDIWQDRELLAGADFEKDIFKNINSSQIICLLVSKNFAKSDYCWSKELALALERHKNGEIFIVPIIISQLINWYELPFGHLKAIPKDGKPIDKWENKDEAWEDVVKELTRLVDFINNDKQPKP